MAAEAEAAEEDNGVREMTAESAIWTSGSTDMIGVERGSVTERGTGTGAIATTVIFARDVHHSERDHHLHPATFGTGTAMDH